ncbi:methylated-DNA--[protein]-cysteine S-methyltransferase [Lignipirellula cremea]|uniref:Methylated-DNA--protein-cysteine methyltransferase n=1 Tax=Lignipirellula cremea TaxID=2528010 RepID=A0A518DPA3_9BACT|nr:methylated-DNA--[protein]-cysteine S-methyltransferase [Lignipirellula cremea]QDU93665.1 Methylated-DNA--protein-cysteine methyltransferase [Lignipirellula cremea]
MNGELLWLDSLETPTGRVLVVTDQKDRLRAVDWDDYRPRMERLLLRYGGNDELQEREPPGESAACRAIRAYFAGDLQACDALDLAVQGTEFQQAVWRELRAIPPGQTLSYGELATRIGRPGAARAVGMANGSNPTPIVAPCHRVIGANASLTGFGGGLERKRWLLAHEQAVPVAR